MAHAQTLPGVEPTRAVAVLWPLWRVDASAEIYDRQPFGVVDRFVLRAVDEGGFTEAAELAAFLSLPPGQVATCVKGLAQTGLLTQTGPRLGLSDLGRASLKDAIRYVPRTSKHTLLIEQQSGWPLPRAYYDAGVEVLDGSAETFVRLGNGAAFGPGVLTWLREHPDPSSFSLPGQLRSLRQEAPAREGFLPGYLVHTAGGQVLAYSALGEHRDEFLERLYTSTPSLRLADLD